jgi:hypothetical protein
LRKHRAELASGGVVTRVEDHHKTGLRRAQHHRADAFELPKAIDELRLRRRAPLRRCCTHVQ